MRKKHFLTAAAFLIFLILFCSACLKSGSYVTDLKESPEQTEAAAEAGTAAETETITETDAVEKTDASYNTDMIGGTENMGENTEKIVCSCCGKVISESRKFCPECGAPLFRTDSTGSSGADAADTGKNANDGTNTGTNNNPGTGMNPGMFIGMGLGTDLSGTGKQDQAQVPDAVPVNIYPDDSDLKLLVDCCNKAGPLAGGIIRSSEIVLYYDEKTDGYQIHTYASDGYGSGKHEGYYTTKEHAALVMQSIDEDAVLKQKDMPEPVGGSRILKFRNEKDEMIRVQCSTGVLSEIKNSVEGRLSEAVRPENRIIPEEAKDWKYCAVFSTGMSMDNCFNYELERTENGKTRVKGKCFVRGIAHEQKEWTELSEKEAAELEKIPLGLMLSNIVTAPNPAIAAGFMGMVQDGDSLSVSITYADGKRDTKIADREMIRALDELMKRVL